MEFAVIRIGIGAFDVKDLLRFSFPLLSSNSGNPFPALILLALLQFLLPVSHPARAFPRTFAHTLFFHPDKYLTSLPSRHIQHTEEEERIKEGKKSS